MTYFYLMKFTRSFYVGLCLFITGCTQAPESTVPVYQVQEKSFAIEVDSFGEIAAARSQKIFSPGRRPMTIAWLQDENTHVKKGEVIARFDAQLIQKDSRSEELELLKIDQDILKNKAKQREQKEGVTNDQGLVQHEFDFVDRFAIDDLRIYSQLEIIDTLANRDFLEAKDEFLDWKEDSLDQQHDSQMAVLDIRRVGVDAKFQQFKQDLSSLEVISPYSGLLIYEKDRRGEKPSIGQTIFPGRPIAQIPNLENMQARLYVQANEAIDLAKGQALSLTLDAFPERTFEGVVASVSSFPRSIRRGDPVTYFELLADIQQQDKTLMQPGRKVNATIFVKPARNRLVVPLQTLHHEAGETYVYVQMNSAGQGDVMFKKQVVESGVKNLHMIEIFSGVSEGQFVALSPPKSSQISEGETP